MDGAATIQPFGFDRIFFHPDEPAQTGAAAPGEASPVLAPEASPVLLRQRIEELEQRVEGMQAAHRAELARVRSEGFETGLAQARSERGEALLAATDALHAALDGIEAKVEDVTRRMVGEAGAVALHAAEMLAGHAIENTPTRAVDEALARVLEQVTHGTTLVIRVNPEMREEIAALVEARAASTGRVLAVTVVDDPAVPEGDARIEWSAGGLNVDAEARRYAVMAELAGVLL